MIAISKLIINGVNKLSGEVNVHGAKNSVLPILAATILCGDECVIHNCPHLSDVDVSIRILSYLGAKIKREGNTLIVDTKDISKYDIPDALMREMRSSIIFLGAVLSRTKRAIISLPGGCELGPRPIDLHISALKQMGMEIDDSRGAIECKVKDSFKGAKISLSFPSVGATENILLASVISKGQTIITNAAREPEISDLINFLNECGARISGSEDGVIVINGVKELHGTEHHVIPDRISAATFLSCAAITGSCITVSSINPKHMSSVFPLFEETGCKMKIYKDTVEIKSPEKLLAIKTVRTMPYPGFPTDAQAILMSVLTVADGTSIFIENIFENRYKHVCELSRLGANIQVEGKVAVVEGVSKLSGALLEGKDLRGTAALIVAGLGSEGQTEITGLNYLDRGYEKIEKSLCSLGAKIKRID